MTITGVNPRFLPAGWRRDIPAFVFEEVLPDPG